MADHKRRLIWSSDARADLEEIWNYYLAIAGRHTADNVIREIGAACQALDEHPLAGRARDEVRAGLRSIAASPFVIFYRVKNETPEVIRVLDGRRDIDEIFRG